MAVDLLRIFIYADGEGHLHDVPIRRMFSLVDGVIGGEGNGPLVPDSKRCGLIVAGFNSCAVDAVCARLMGFDYNKLRILAYPLAHPAEFRCKIKEIRVHTNNERFRNLFIEKSQDRYFAFRPPRGWEGFIELW
jgi:hypothetical protein